MRRGYWLELDDVIADRILDWGGLETGVTAEPLHVEGLADAVMAQRHLAPHLVVPPTRINEDERRALLTIAAAASEKRLDPIAVALAQCFLERAALNLEKTFHPPFDPEPRDKVLWRTPGDGGIWSGPGTVALADSKRVVVEHVSGCDVLLSRDHLEFTLADQPEVAS